MENSGPSNDKGAIPKIIKEKSFNVAEIASSDIKYPLEPKPGISCIPHQQSSSVVRTRSLTSINLNRSVRLDVVYRNESPATSNDSSMQVIFIKSKSKSEHVKK